MADPEAVADAGALPADWRLRHQIRTRHLLLLQALDRHGSLSQAADALAVTQPAATKMLAQLENLLQLPLFERLPRGLRATEYGQIMIRHAHAALGEIGAGQKAGGTVAVLSRDVARHYAAHKAFHTDNALQIES